MSKRNELEKFPLYQKAEQIFKITQGLVEIIPADNEFLQETRVRFMLENAMIIPAKIAAARELYVQAGSLRFEEGITDKDYILLLRKEIDEFRLLFIDWVASFDVWNYIKDDWGLFNPPGVNAHDKDPDEDIPFNLDDFFDFEDGE